MPHGLFLWLGGSALALLGISGVIIYLVFLRNTA